jgi:hypothetical protein
MSDEIREFFVLGAHLDRFLPDGFGSGLKRASTEDKDFHAPGAKDPSRRGGGLLMFPW